LPVSNTFVHLTAPLMTRTIHACWTHGQKYFNLLGLINVD